MQFIKKYGYWIIFTQALLAMLGSLYYGYFWDPYENLILWKLFDADRWFAPCNLCWYARILMYPIVWFSLFDIVRKQTWSLLTIKWVSFVWILLELRHYLLQKVNIDVGTTCTAAHPCDALYVNYFGFVTIPFLCLVAFVVIFVTSHLLLKQTKK